MIAKPRIALYGGTFDPVHLGHVEIARRVSKLFEINTVLFVPAQIAPHKVGRTVTSPIHRYAMLVLATQVDPHLLVSTFELDAPNRRYTVDTIAHFQGSIGDAQEIFFIMGADSWSEITSWHEWERLLTMTNHIVVTRPNYEIHNPAVTPAVRSRIIDLRSAQGDVKALLAKSTGPHIFVTDVVMKDVSATEIRRAARDGRTRQLDHFVPIPVAEYIAKYGIYREENETEFHS